jgi:hypothetical protein
MFVTGTLNIRDVTPFARTSEERGIFARGQTARVEMA